MYYIGDKGCMHACMVLKGGLGSIICDLYMYTHAVLELFMHDHEITHCMHVICMQDWPIATYIRAI